MNLVIGTSPPYNPDAEKAHKVEHCKSLLELQPKLPQRVQQYYDHIQTKLCPDESVKIYDIFTYIKDNLSGEL